MHKIMKILSVFLSLFFISSCYNMGKKSHSVSKKDKKSCCGEKSCCGPGGEVGLSNVIDLRGGKISGSVLFEDIGQHKVKVTANIKGLAPNQKFAFHVHEFGTCENKGLLAGAHLNPWGSHHAGPHDEDRHAGDLGNLKSDKSGHSNYTVSVKGKLLNFMGRSVIIHAKEDDMKTQPTGNAGVRIACGIVTASMSPIHEEKQESSEEKSKSVSDKPTAKKMEVVSDKPTVEKAQFVSDKPTAKKVQFVSDKLAEEKPKSVSDKPDNKKKY
ncbi:MAG: superoxide dismutase family protein [Bdellovibrionaceae bacterium]|nr:superoxide dismutase family protein [Pseudobdellovibrionaceae bacterium]